MDEHEEVQERNMISNLPLLFANGYPTSLDKISEKQLENFIPFMVQCSLGHINLMERLDSSEPEWWPEDVPFTIPLMKPKKFTGNWMKKMKEIVYICYQFHKSVFLLRFCNDLSSYEHACLRFINNYNSTTSLFERRSNKLLVTFRNENMSYDQPQRGRKCLLQQKSKNQMPSQEVQQMMVEPAPFDIYLCDNCDAELYSKEAILEHEKTCLIEDDDDDVILCDSPEPAEILAPPPDMQQQTNSANNTQDDELRRLFLLNFGLGSTREADKLKKPPETAQTSETPVDTEPAENTTKKRRPPRRNRPVHMLTRSPIIPISSPAGQVLQRITKTTVTQEYLGERYERLERFCQAAPLQSGPKPKYFERKTTGANPHCTFKKPPDYSPHLYVFPRRHYSQRRRAENVQFLNSELLKRCRPISVRLKKITDQEVRAKQQPTVQQATGSSRSASGSSSNSSGTSTNTKLNIRLKRDATQSSNWKISSGSSPATAEIIVDTIDLCSSDDDDNVAVCGGGGGGGVADADIAKTVSNAAATKQNANAKSLFVAGTGKNNSKTTTTRTNIQLKNTQSQQVLLNQPEISIIPIRKVFGNCSMQYDAVRKNSNVIRIVSAAGNDKSTNSQYDNNILIATPAPATAPADATMDSVPKPLRPSVFILSNINRPNSSSLLTSANESVATANSSCINHNQENRLQQNGATTMTMTTATTTTTLNTNFNNKHTNNNNNNNNNINPSTLSVTDWFPESSNANPNTNRNNQNARSVVQTFGSPNRVISIDLTS